MLGLLPLPPSRLALGRPLLLPPAENRRLGQASIGQASIGQASIGQASIGQASIGQAS